MKLPAAEHATFLTVASHHGWDAGEIAAAKDAYRADPAAGRDLYQALYHTEVSQQWRIDMSKGTNERIINDFKRLKELLLATKAAEEAGGPGQPDLANEIIGSFGLIDLGPGQPEKPLRPPPPAEPHEQPTPPRQDPPKEVA